MSTYGGNEPTSRPVHNDPPPSGTHAGADATSRMSGIHTTGHGSDDGRPAEGGIHNTDDRRDDEVRTVHTDEVRGKHVADDEVVHEDRGRKVLPAKTSAAATFTLVFGLAALFCALTAILAPVAVLLSLIGIGLGVVALKMVKRPGVTGKGLALGGLVTAVLGLALGIAVIAGAAVIVNDDAQLNQIQERLDDLRADLPSLDTIQEEVPG